MDMTFTIAGGSRAEAEPGPFTIATDQPPDASAPRKHLERPPSIDLGVAVLETT